MNIQFQRDYKSVCRYADSLPDSDVNVEGFKKTVRVCRYALTTYGKNYGTKLFLYWNDNLIWEWEERDTQRILNYVIKHNNF